MKVWVVTASEYEDHWMCGVFASKELANKFINEREAADMKKRYSRRNNYYYAASGWEVQGD